MGREKYVWDSGMVQGQPRELYEKIHEEGEFTVCWALSITVPGATYLELFLHSSPVHLPFMATQVPILEMRKPKHRQKVIELG